MKKSLAMLIVILVVGFGLGYLAGQNRDSRAYAAQGIPKTWGSFRGGASDYLYFEGSDGTIRVYDMVSNRLTTEYQRD